MVLSQMSWTYYNKPEWKRTILISIATEIGEQNELGEPELLTADNENDAEPSSSMY